MNQYSSPWLGRYLTVGATSAHFEGIRLSHRSGSSLRWLSVSITAMSSVIMVFVSLAGMPYPRDGSMLDVLTHLGLCKVQAGNVNSRHFGSRVLDGPAEAIVRIWCQARRWSRHGDGRYGDAVGPHDRCADGADAEVLLFVNDGVATLLGCSEITNKLSHRRDRLGSECDEGEAHQGVTD